MEPKPAFLLQVAAPKPFADIAIEDSSNPNAVYTADDVERGNSNMEKRLRRAVQRQIEISLSKQHTDLLSKIRALMSNQILSVPRQKQESVPESLKDATQISLNTDQRPDPRPKNAFRSETRSISNLGEVLSKVAEDAKDILKTKEERIVDYSRKFRKDGTESSDSTVVKPAAPYVGSISDGLSFSYKSSTEATVNASDPPTTSRINNILYSKWFEFMIGISVLTSAIFIGWEVNYVATHPGVIAVPLRFKLASYFYTIVFTVELIFRLVSNFWGFCWASRFKQLLWNYLDVFIVISSLIEGVLDLFANLAAASGDRVNVTNVRVIRVVRIFRLIRLIRIARFVRFVRALRMMVFSILCTIKLIFWAMVLLGTIIYIFSILFTSAATSHSTKRMLQTDIPEIPDLETHWGSINASMRSLFMSVSGGVSWIEVIDPLTEINVLWAYLFLLYISFTYFAVLNVVTGTFCQAAMQTNSEDQDSMMQTFLRHKKIYTERFMELFQGLDSSGTGIVTYHEFVQKMGDEDVRNYFASLDLESADALCLFDLFEEESQYGIKIEEFVMGCLRLKGLARSSDVLKLLHENRLVLSQLDKLSDYFGLSKAHRNCTDQTLQRQLLMAESAGEISKIEGDRVPSYLSQMGIEGDSASLTCTVRSKTQS